MTTLLPTNYVISLHLYAALHTPHFNSLYTKDCIYSPTAHNAFILWTAYAVHAFKKSMAGWSHGVYETPFHSSTSQPFIGASVPLVQLRLVCCICSDWPGSVCHLLGKKPRIFSSSCKSPKYKVNNLKFIHIINRPSNSTVWKVDFSVCFTFFF